jgi:hypothetical protein
MQHGLPSGVLRGDPGFCPRAVFQQARAACFVTKTATALSCLSFQSIVADYRLCATVTDAEPLAPSKTPTPEVRLVLV